MNYKKYNISEVEMSEYCDSLSEKELKEFQLNDGMNEINTWKHKFIYSVLNIIMCILIFIWAVKVNLPYIQVGICIAGIVLSLYGIRCYNYMKSKQLLYRMLKIFFEENKI